MPAEARPYHHGNLRAALLDAAERSVEKSGTEQLSLRELARVVGVSHAAPRAHFTDRQALLDALAERGFGRLGAQLKVARDGAGPGFGERLRAVIAGFIAFANSRPVLLDLMFSAKSYGDKAQLPAAAETLAVVYDLIGDGVAEGALAPGDPERYGLLLYSWAQGLASLIASGGLQPEVADSLVSDAVSTFIRGNAAG
ncbi:TetR/AcrR family transcriptional regulator [Streptomyces brasiliensis]|uniref:TetR family transcriptional regulator n=1 Tax=Streptomyces brasiliensis TaxID=1954 RepID=A0A917LB73_9ACTN|nr:TetR/AcrR family transcriptional regulator [Streptomyces brasiliensis]GGJ50345.1 TetR family transcriptional regulator [Streptomyces brasiliensis]